MACRGSMRTVDSFKKTRLPGEGGVVLQLAPSLCLTTSVHYKYHPGGYVGVLHVGNMSKGRLQGCKCLHTL